MEANLLILAGNDPSGGAGLSADLLAARHFNVHACPVVTCATAQNTRDVRAIHALPASLIEDQLGALLDDFRFDALKIGLIGSLDIAQVILSFKQTHLELPMILDPVLRAGGGSSLATAELTEFIASELLPLAHIATPNSEEARKLSGCGDLAQATQRLLEKGMDYLLVKGAHEAGETIVNRLYASQGEAQSLRLEQRVTRLPGDYHGSGCTLATACASLIAKGVATETAVKTALAFTDQSLMQAYLPAQGQWIPRR